MNYNDICKQSVAHFGLDNRLLTTVQNCAELSEAILRLRNNKCTCDLVRESIADVIIMCAVLALEMGKPEVDAIVARKMKRLEQMMNQK